MAPKPGRIACTVRTPRRPSHSATGADRRPAEIASRGQGGTSRARDAASSPARVGHGHGTRAHADQPSGTTRNGTPSRSAMPSAWFAVPGRGSASTQTGSVVPPLTRGYVG